MRLIEIIIGVFIGSFLSSVAYEQFTIARAEHAARKATQALQAQVRAQQEAAAREQRERMEAEQATAAERAAYERQIAERQRQQAAARREAVERQEKREAAWKRFYKPAPGCDDSGLKVECANHHIKERRRFDVMYDAGQLQ